MDIMMPDMDGCQAATEIKKITGNEYTPIIFITALSSEDSLVTALDAGGDDFITKPFNVEVLQSKIKVHLRIQDLNQQLSHKNHLLNIYNQKLTSEQELIEHFFESAINQSYLDDDIVRYHMSSMAAFNGDLLLAERAPDGGYYLIIGDFSGHGLSAAMGTLPVAMIFFKMVLERYAVGDIAKEINHQLLKLMPSGMFLAATIVEINASGTVMSVWMGGMPECYSLSQNNDFKEEIHSQHMPLGILEDEKFNSSVQVFSVKHGDKIYLYSDGIVESKNTNDELYGNERLKKVIVESKGDRFDNILNDLKHFTAESNQNDDTTLLELTCNPLPAFHVPTEEINIDTVLPWNLSISLSENDMRSAQAVNKLTNVLSSMPYVSRHKGVLHVLLGEIYSNCLDHSILNIKSASKLDEPSFEDYYIKRDEALLKLENASIDFNFKFFIDKNECYLEINVHDSGIGYTKNTSSTDNDLHGRGLGIITNFSENVSFSDDGNGLTLLFKV